jgi:N-acetylmuramoyl-L-alanine amidase
MTSFRADTAVPATVMPSPNHGPRRNGIAPDILLLHYTGMRTADAAVKRLCDPASEVSAHYLVHEDGGIVQMVPEQQRAWHAGQSGWARIKDINSHSIGIEIVNPGHDHGYRAFPARQMDAVIALSADIVARCVILPERVLAHSDVAPLRKVDPGERFAWDALHEAGVGHWVRPARLTPKGSGLSYGDTGRDVVALQKQLRAYGYVFEASGTYDLVTTKVVAAFQRHFRPKRVDGVADMSTRATLEELLAARPLH